MASDRKFCKRVGGFELTTRAVVKARKSGKPSWQDRSFLALVRDAGPTARELEGRPNILDVRDAERSGQPINDTPNRLKAHKAVLARDIARAELVRRYREAKKAHTLRSFDTSARVLVEELIRANGGTLPKAKFPNLGRPREFGKRLLIYFAVRDELDRLGGRGRGNVAKALHAVAGRERKSAEQVRDIFYNKHPEWLEAIELELEWRREWADQPAIELRIQGQEITPAQFDEYFTLAAAQYPTGIPNDEANTELWSWARRASFPGPWCVSNFRPI